MSDEMSITIDWSAELERAQALPAERRLAALLAGAGCEMHPEDGRFVMAPSAKLWAIGGLPARALMAKGISLEEAAGWTAETMGSAGAMSYLSLPGGSAGAAYEKILGELGHCSAAHAASASIVVAGVSCAVENEFNSQRDLVHMARVTEARSSCQASPCLVVHEPIFFELSRKALDAIEAIVAQAPSASEGVSKADAKEALHNLFPSSKATVFVLTGTLRNFQKLLAARGDPGKEKEFRRMLRLIHATLGSAWPLLFPFEGKNDESA